jgi:hypothetical protein
LYGCAVPVYIYESPQRVSGVHASEKQPLILAIDAEVNVPGGINVVVENIVFFAESLAEGFRPVAGFVGEVWAGVFWEGVREGRGVVAREAETNDAAPTV